MDINSTLFGQMITFGLFVWFTMKFVWPMLEETLEARHKKIADGMAAADQGQRTLKEAEQKIRKELSAARNKAQEIIVIANKQAGIILENAKKDAVAERDNIVKAGEQHLQQELQQAKIALRTEIVGIAVTGAAKLIGRNIEPDDKDKFFDELLAG